MGVTRSYSRALRGGGWGARAIRGWQTRRDRRRHGSPQLVPGCRHQLGQVPLRLLLSSAGGQTKQGKASYSEREREREKDAGNGRLRRNSVDLEDKFCTCSLLWLASTFLLQRLATRVCLKSSRCMKYSQEQAFLRIATLSCSMHTAGFG